VRDAVEERPDVAAGLAAGRFDLDHIGPEIAEQLAAELPGLVGELQDSEARQRPRQRRIAHWGIAHRSISSM